MADEEVTPLLDAPTTNYGWAKPTVGADVDAWGTYLNQNFDGVDTIVHGIDATAVRDSAADGTAYVRKNGLWVHLTHTDITDWTAALTAVLPVASSTTPPMNGVASIGVSATFARADHVHPTDSTLLPRSGGTLTGPLTLSADPAAALQPATKQYVDALTLGVTNGSNAAAGQVGEVVTQGVVQAGGVTLSNNVTATITTISLTPGDWDVCACINFYPAATTTGSAVSGAIFNAVGYPPRGASTGIATLNGNIPAGSTSDLPIPSSRFSLSTSQTIYLNAVATFAVSTMKAGGFIYARRVR